MTTVPVGLSRDLAPGRVMRAWVSEVDVAIWRDLQGTAHAWNNRCPHRGMRLSHGFVRGDRLACLYHGWQFGKSGGCAHIPAHPDLEPPATIHTQVYDVAEGGGVLWVRVDGPAEVPEMPDGFAPLRSMIFDCSAETAIQALAGTPLDDVTPQKKEQDIFQLGALKIRALCNPIGGDETSLHFLVSAGATVGECRMLSRWCDAARRAAEAGKNREAA